MPERLYQLTFESWGNQLEYGFPQEVTPREYRGLGHLTQGRDIKPRLTFNLSTEYGRFMREVASKYTVTSPDTAARYLQDNVFTPFEQCDQEELWTLCLNTKNRITHDAMVYRGNVNSSIIRLAEVFRPAILVNATAIIISHNHPSGDPSPSPEDVQITRSTVEAGQLLGMELLDHIVVGNQHRWVSLKEQGLGFR